MKILLDFFPILLFFIAYKLGDIYIATGVAIVTSFTQVLFLRLLKGFIEKTHLITLATLIILGGATLIFQNEQFIKWKPTAIYWAMSGTFLWSQFFGKKTFIEHIASKSLSLPMPIWRRLNLSWCCFFAFMGCLNLYVVHTFDTDTWVNFKLFGTLLLTLLFIAGQAIYMTKYIRNGNQT